jgi:membrane-associated phospholipid phosphatase
MPHKERVARFVSTIFSPYIVAVFAITVVSFAATPRISAALIWTVAIVTMMVVPPLAYVWYQVRKGKITDLHVRVRSERDKVYAVAMISLLSVLVVLWFFDGPVELLALFTSVLVDNAISFIINTRWKISLHAAGMGGTTVVIYLLLGSVAGFIWLISSLLVMWSRVETHSHTMLQTFAGYLLAALVALAVFSVFGLT